MKQPPIPANEPERLQVLQRYQILDTAPEQAFDDLTNLAAYICGTPMALITLVDANRQWFKSKVGFEAFQTPRELAFCAHTICKPNEVLIVPNTLKDERFFTNPFVTSEPNIRFYIGAPLVTPDNFALGTICAIDVVPREITKEQILALQALSRQVVRQLELRINLVNLKNNILAREQVEKDLRNTNEQLNKTLRKLRKTQAQLIQSEKMSSLGQVVAGVAHEINNPVNFIEANLSHLKGYVKDLIDLLSLYQLSYPDTNAEIEKQKKSIDLEFIGEDLPKILSSMSMGTERIQKIVTSLRNFSRLDEAEKKSVNIHEGIDSTLIFLQHRLKATNKRPEIKIIRDYAKIPLIECYPAQLNQVFMNILSNAIDAIEELRSKSEVGQINIQTKINQTNYLVIKIADNGMGIKDNIVKNIFDPFFTTKPVGKGTGLGLAISYQIVVEKHKGTLKYKTTLGKGTEFWIEIPFLSRGA